MEKLTFSVAKIQAPPVSFMLTTYERKTATSTDCVQTYSSLCYNYRYYMDQASAVAVIMDRLLADRTEVLIHWYIPVK